VYLIRIIHIEYVVCSKHYPLKNTAAFFFLLIEKFYAPRVMLHFYAYVCVNVMSAFANNEICVNLMIRNGAVECGAD